MCYLISLLCILIRHRALLFGLIFIFLIFLVCFLSVLCMHRYLCPLFRFPGNEEVKLAILPALASWVARSADALQRDVVSFLVSGLKEKEGLRRGHLRCLRFIFKNTDAIILVRRLIMMALLFLIESCLGCSRLPLTVTFVIHASGIIFAGPSCPTSKNRFY